MRARVGVLIAAAVLAACGRAATSSTTGLVAEHGPRSGPTLVGVMGGSATLALDQVPTTLNDHALAGDTPATRLVASAVWPQVFQVGPNQTPLLNTSVVQSAELVSVDPPTVVYQIDPRAVWSDGVAISADDFVYAWRAQRGGATDLDGKPDSVASTLGYRDIGSVVGSNGGRTVTVVFKVPFGDWASLFDDLLPAHVAEKYGWNQGFDSFNPSVLVSGGAWLVASWDPGRKIVLVRNPRWWGSPPHLSQVVIKAAPDAATLLSVLRGSSAVVAYPSSFDQALLAQLSSNPTLESSSSLGTTMLQLVFNTRHAPFDSPAVRQGIAHSIDRAGLVTNLVQPLEPSVWIDNDHLFANTQPQYVDGASGYVQADPVAAGRLLAQGGLIADTNGTWTSRGTPVTIQLAWAYDDPWSSLVAPDVAAQLMSSGFDVTSEPMSALELVGGALPAGTFDLAIAPIPASCYPSDIAAYFTTNPALTSPDVSLDWSGLNDPKFDALFVQASQQLGSNQADPLYRQIDQELWAQMPTFPLFAEPTLLVNSAWLNAVQADPGGLGPMFSVNNWYRLQPLERKNKT